MNEPYILTINGVRHEIAEGYRVLRWLSGYEETPSPERFMLEMPSGSVIVVGLSVDIENRISDIEYADDYERSIWDWFNRR